jgi:hypothetical protein
LTALLTTKQQIHSIESVVSAAFSRAGITKEVLYNGPVKHTELVWQNPPLKPERVYVDNIPISEYYAVSMDIDTIELVNFYKFTLRLMKSQPKLLFKRGDFLGITKVFGKTYVGQRAFRFSVPEGYPSVIDDYSALVFALEVVDLAVNALPITCFEDTNSYYVKLGKDYVGVKDGLICGVPEWPMNYSGLVQDFLNMPRGASTTLCLYDTLAKIRSTLWEHKSLFGENFLGLDYLIQLLRVLDKHNIVGEVLKAGKVVHVRAMVSSEEQLSIVKKCIATMKLINMSDKSKIRTIKSELVPLVMASTAFNKEVYNTYHPIPFSVSEKVSARVFNKLLELERGLTCRLNA